MGGLNFQIEHHLFPDVCHVHYPALARVVEAACLAHGIPYRAHPTLRNAIAAHFRFLARAGVEEEAPSDHDAARPSSR